MNQFSKYERKISKADKHLQDVDGGPQGCDGDAGPRVPGQSEAHLGGEDGLRFSGPDSLQSFVAKPLIVASRNN